MLLANVYISSFVLIFPSPDMCPPYTCICIWIIIVLYLYLYFYLFFGVDFPFSRAIYAGSIPHIFVMFFICICILFVLYLFLYFYPFFCVDFPFSRYMPAAFRTYSLFFFYLRPARHHNACPDPPSTIVCCLFIGSLSCSIPPTTQTYI